MRRKNQGFTLVELIVTIAIIAIFSGVVLTVVGTGANTFRSTSSNAKVQMKAQDIMDQIQDMIIDVNRSVYYAYGNGIEADTGALVSNDIDTGAVAQNKTFYACTATEIEPDNDPAQEGKPYHYVCDLIEWDSVEQKLYYAQSTWDGRETEKKKNAGNSIESSTTGAANGNGSDQTGDSIGNGLNSAAQLVAESKTDDDAPIVLDDPDMELASAQSDNSNGDNLVSTPTSEIQISDKTLLAENVTDFRVDVSKVVSERVVRFQFTVKLKGKETTSVHTVNLRNQIQVSKPFEGYSSNTSGEAIITIIRYPETVEAGKTATGFSLYKDGAIDPTTITWVVESNNAQIVGGGADDASVTLTANEGLPNDTIITVHVEATTSDGKLIQSKSVQIKVKNTKVPQSLVCNNTDGILLGVGGTDYDLKSLGWKIQYSDGSSESLTEEQLKSISWATDSAITGVSVAASGESGGNITVTKANDGPGTTEQNSKFKVTASCTTESGNTVSGTIPVTLARLDITGTTAEFHVGDTKNLTYSYKVGGVEQNTDSQKISNGNGTVDNITFAYTFNNDSNNESDGNSGSSKLMSTGDQFVNDDIGNWTVTATLDMSTVGGMGGSISSEYNFSVLQTQSTDNATLKLHHDSGLDTIAPNQDYWCSPTDNKEDFYIEANWNGNWHCETTWKISHNSSVRTGFKTSNSEVVSEITIQDHTDAILHVDSNEKGFLLEGDLKVRLGDTNSVAYHYHASMNVKVVTGVRIINTFEPIPDASGNFKAIEGQKYDLRAEVAISQYNSSTIWKDLGNENYVWKIIEGDSYLNQIVNNTKCKVGVYGKTFTIQVNVKGTDNSYIWKLGDGILNTAANVTIEQRTAEIIVVNNKTSLFPGDTAKLYLKLNNSDGPLDGSADWSVSDNSKLNFVADTENQTVCHQDSIYSNNVFVPIEVKAMLPQTGNTSSIHNVTVSVQYKYSVNGKDWNNTRTLSANITITPLNMVINPSSYEAYESNPVDLTAGIYDANSNNDVTDGYSINWELEPADDDCNISKTSNNKASFTVKKSPKSMKTVKIKATAKNGSGDIVCTASVDISINKKKTVTKLYNLGQSMKQKLFKNMDGGDTDVKTFHVNYVKPDGIMMSCNIESIPTVNKLSTGEKCKQFEVEMNRDSSDFGQYKYILISVDTDNTLYKFYIYPVKSNVYECKKGEAESGKALTYVPTDIESIQRSSNLLLKDNADNGNGYTYKYEFGDYKAEIRLSIDSRTGLGYFSGNYVESSAGKWIMRMAERGTDWKYYRLENDKWYLFQNGDTTQNGNEKTKRIRYYWSLNQDITLRYDSGGNALEPPISNTAFWYKWN